MQGVVLERNRYAIMRGNTAYEKDRIKKKNKWSMQKIPWQWDGQMRRTLNDCGCWSASWYAGNCIRLTRVLTTPEYREIGHSSRRVLRIQLESSQRSGRHHQSNHTQILRHHPNNLDTDERLLLPFYSLGNISDRHGTSLRVETCLIIFSPSRCRNFLKKKLFFIILAWYKVWFRRRKTTHTFSVFQFPLHRKFWPSP